MVDDYLLGACTTMLLIEAHDNTRSPAGWEAWKHPKKAHSASPSPHVQPQSTRSARKKECDYLPQMLNTIIYNIHIKKHNMFVFD